MGSPALTREESLGRAVAVGDGFGGVSITMPDGSVESADSPARALRKAVRWFAFSHRRGTVGLGRLEWRGGLAVVETAVEIRVEDVR